MVERLFRNITGKILRRGVFHSVENLVAAIEEHIAVHNRDPKPFIWTATTNDILEKVKRGRSTLDNMQTA